MPEKDNSTETGAQELWPDWQPIDTLLPKPHGFDFLVCLRGETDRAIQNTIDDPVNGFYYGPDIITVQGNNEVSEASYYTQQGEAEDGSEYEDIIIARGDFFRPSNGISHDHYGDEIDELDLTRAYRVSHWMPLPKGPKA